ncbi:MAG: hypothetical protein WC373_11845 [Smithella sp.]
MLEKDRKILTEYLGEEYHDVKISDGYDLSRCSCGVTGIAARMECTKANRTFQTPQDFYDLCKVMVEKREFEVFVRYAATNHYAKVIAETVDDINGMADDEVTFGLMQWLILGPDNCQLVADWLRQEGEIA